MLTSLTLTRERDERESLNASKRIAVRAKSAAFADLKVQSRAYFNERRRLLSLADSVRARDGSSSEAWVELMPLLLNRIDGKSIIASRNAGRLLRELSSIASSHTAPCVPYLTSAIVSPPINFSRPIRVASLFDGYSGFLIALLEALAGSLLDVDVVHAADSMQSKVNLAAAVASICGMRHHAPPIKADVTDTAFYTETYCASLGALDLLAAGFPCIFHSPEGRKKGVVKNLRAPECKALADGFFRILSLTKPRNVIIECSAFLKKDPYFDSDFLNRLGETYWVAHIVLDAARWLCINRERVYLICFRDHAAYSAFTAVSPPPCTEVRLASVLLPPGHPLLPSSVYDVVKARGEAISIAAHTVAEQPLITGMGRSKVGVFKRKIFRALRTAKPQASPKAGKVARMRSVIKRGVVPTLIKSSSGVLRVRDERGSRSLCARECARLHGVPSRYTEAMLTVSSDAGVVAAIGDGFAIPVVRDVLKSVLRASGYGV